MQDKVLIYGASGYVGKLFAKFLIERKIEPILAGRSKAKFKDALLQKCEYRQFLAHEITHQLNDIKILVNVASSFNLTQASLIEACIRSGTNYIDITGEALDIQKAFQYFNQAKEAKITIIPGSGFGVVPTDIGAKIAASQISNPKRLTIAYATKGIASRGTVRTLLRDINKEGFIVKEGKFIKAKPASKEFTFKHENQEYNCVYNPWRADLFTARISTEIANIETYSEFPSFIVDMMHGKKIWLRNLFLNLLIKFIPEGPSETQLEEGSTIIKILASNDIGQESSVQITGPEAYKFTIQCMALIMEKIENSEGPYGVFPPSIFGTEWLENMKDVTVKKQINSLN